MKALIPGVRVNGGGAPRVGGTSSLSFDGVESDGLVMALDLEGFCVSSGSACASGVLEPSHVLLAMGRTREQATAAIRVSISERNSWEDLAGLIDILVDKVRKFRTPDPGLKIEDSERWWLKTADIRNHEK